MPNTLVVTKGHPFEREPFFAMLERVITTHALGELTHVEHPAASAVFAPETLASFDTVVFYDMPGIEFGGDAGPVYTEPRNDFKKNLQLATERGVGLVFLHHAIAGWPTWEDYAELIGGRFCYTPQTLRGQPVSDSGYRHKVGHVVAVVAEHPVTAGVDPQFSMVDELYLSEVFEDSVQPLLRSSHKFSEEGFYSAAKAVVEGEMFSNAGWSHPPGSNLVGWTREHNASRIVYLQGGDDAQAWDNSNYQKLLGNAIRWAGRYSPDPRS